MIKYYKWVFQFWFYEKFSATFVDRFIFMITGNFLDLPRGHFPMKYNDKTEEFDKFYSWKEIVEFYNSFQKN